MIEGASESGELIKAALEQPGGWVYEIAGDYEADGRIPPTAIRGAWKVDLDGGVVGDMIPNPQFDQSLDGGAGDHSRFRGSIPSED